MIIGIDLGTSTCEAAIFRGGFSEILRGRDGNAVTPSFVGLDDNGEWIAGEKARERYLLYPDLTAREVKRLMGTDQKVRLGNAEYTPVELSAKLLAHMKEAAQAALGEEVKAAVITVPAYFNDVQRRETVQAGSLAGLRVERVINEPTAAALSYGAGHMEDESVILVYDLGGGTFDVTVLELFSGVMEVKASGGKTDLGGKDFDDRLVDELIARFRAKNPKAPNLRDDPAAMARLKDAAAACKTALSERESSEVSLPLLIEKDGSPLSLAETVTREEFEALIRPLVGQTGPIVQRALRDSGISAGQLDLVLLTGGSTRIPLVKRFVQELLGMPPSEAADPELAVALGAAIQAGILEGAAGEDGILITDVCPFALGIACRADLGFMEVDDYMSVILPRNVTIPVTEKKVYATAHDYQREVEIEVYQGDSRVASENAFLGKFSLRGVPPRKAGEEKVEVSFSYDANGLLAVGCTIVSTGESAFIDIDMTGAKEAAKRDVSGWKDAPRAAKYRSVIRKTERMLKGSGLDEDWREDAQEILYALKAALLDAADAETLDDYEEDLLALMEELE